MAITDERTEDLERMARERQKSDIKEKLAKAGENARQQRDVSREQTRDAIWDFANRFGRAIAEGYRINPIDKDPTSDMKGSVLYDYRSKQTLDKQQPQPVSQQSIQPELPQSPSPQPQSRVQAPVQRQVLRPAQPRQVQQVQQQPAQQEIDPNIIMDMINEYQDPNYDESVVYSSPVAEGANDKIINDLIQEGENQEQSNKQSTVADILGKIKAGYNENRDNGFAMENLQSDPTKTGWNRVGEALGTATRMAGNPLVQGLVAGGINGAINKDWGKGLEYGLQYAQNKAKSDAYERAMGRRPSILGGYGVEDYKAKNEADYKQNKIDIENQELDLKKTKQDYDIKNIESQIKDRDVRQQQGWAKIQAQISNNSARLAETRTHNRIMERIQSSRLLDSRDKHMISVEDKIYKADRNAILNDKKLNDDQKAAKLFDLDTQYADNLRKNYGIDYQAEQRKVEQSSGTKPQAIQNTKQQTKSTGKGWAF